MRCPPGKPAALKDGDIVRFGSDSELRVQLTPASNEATTVEQHLRTECDMCAQRIKVGLHYSAVQGSWRRGICRTHAGTQASGV